MMNVTNLDLFYTFRTAIFVGVTIYTGLSLAGTVWQVVTFMRSDDPRTAFIRRYVTYQLATVRLRPLAGELFQILVLAGVLTAIWWAHWTLGLDGSGGG